MEKLGPDCLVPKFWRKNMSEINMMETRPRKIEPKPLKNKYRTNYNHYAWTFNTSQKLDIIGVGIIIQKQKNILFSFLSNISFIIYGICIFDARWDMKSQSCTQDPTDHSRWSPLGKQTMAIRLDKVIGIPVGGPTPDTWYGPECTFTITSATFMYYCYQLQNLN